MNTQAWNAAEIEKTLGLYESGFPCGEIATMIGRTEAAVRYKLYSLGYSSRQIRTSADSGTPETSSTLSIPPAQETAPLETPGEDSDYFRMRAERELEVGSKRRGDREKVEEAKRILLEDRIVDTFRRHLCDMPPRIEISAPSVVSTRSAVFPLTGVLVISDMHGGQVVDPRETEGLGVYNPAIMIARLRHLELEVRRILSHHAVDKLLLLLGGDILHGHLGHTLEDDLTIPIAQQADLLLHALFPFVMSLAGAVPTMEIYGVAGNHGRWPGMRKMPTDRRWSNLDTVLYGALAALIQHSGANHITFDDRVSSRRTIDAGKFRLQLLHGDEVRGGAFCVAGMSKEVSNSTLRHVQRGSAPIDSRPPPEAGNSRDCDPRSVSATWRESE